MKTLEKLYEEIQADSELKKEYVKAAGDKKVVDFLKAHGCDATEAEIESFVKAKKNKDLSDDELDMVSGGGDCTTYTSDGWPVVSAFNSCSHYVFMGDDNGGRKDDRSCGNCIYSKTNDAWLLICYCPQRHESVDDI